MSDTAKILNDKFRTTFSGGRVVMTNSIASHARLEEILKRVQTFDAFSDDNDPHLEHDFGAIEIEGDTVFWKIDVYDKDLQFGSPDPADPKVSLRVITLMLSQEY